MPTSSLRTAGAILLAVLAQIPNLNAQGRQGQAQATPAQAPAREAAPAPQGGRGRGGIPGPGPAIGGDIDETPVVTHHSITVNGKTSTTPPPSRRCRSRIPPAKPKRTSSTWPTRSTAQRPHQAAADVLLQRRPRLGVHVGAHGRHGSAQSQADAQRQHASSALSDEGQPGHLARPDRPGLHRSGRHRLQPRQDHRGRAPHERRAGRYSIGGRVHAHVHRPQQSRALAAVHRRAKATEPSAPPAWPAI